MLPQFPGAVECRRCRALHINTKPCVPSCFQKRLEPSDLQIAGGCEAVKHRQSPATPMVHAYHWEDCGRKFLRRYNMKAASPALVDSNNSLSHIPDTTKQHAFAPSQDEQENPILFFHEEVKCFATCHQSHPYPHFHPHLRSHLRWSRLFCISALARSQGNPGRSGF